MEVHRIMKSGFQEVIYQRALSVELTNNGIKHEREYEMPIFYKGVQIGTRRVDFFIEGTFSVEIKAIAALDDTHLAQGKNYLEAYNLSTGLLLNFGSSSLQVKRLFNQKYRL